MKKYSIYLIIILAIVNFTSCNYLDIVPDERDKEEDAYKDINAAERFLYSCYGYMPNPNNATSSLDFMTGDEVVTGFENEAFAKFPQGNFSGVEPVISYWNDLFAGIRQCYKLMNNLDKVPGMSVQTKTEYTGELKFLIAYYHMLLVRCYGPTIIVREEIDVNTDPSSYLPRSTMAECIKFVTETFDEAATMLPLSRTGNVVGRATQVIAKSLKAYILMYYASPLHNGNSELAAKLVNPDGTLLMSAEYDHSRWEKVRDAYKEAIDLANEAGYELYKEEMPAMTNPSPENATLRVLRSGLISSPANNKEQIWTKIFDEGIYGLQKKSMPGCAGCNNGVAPTLAMVRRFYTKNGLPWDIDPETKDLDEFELVGLNESNSTVTFADASEAIIAKKGKNTSQLNLNREPRYYAWISFHNGYYEVTNAQNNPGHKEERYERNGNGGQVITDFTYNSPYGYGRDQRNNSKTGFLNKKGVDPDNETRANGTTYKQYPWTIIRLSELYLGYAECCAECDDVKTAKIYTNYVRERAGIPSVDESWGKVGITPNAEQMVEIVRRERQIEFYLENQNFWDMRRWLLAENYFNYDGKGDGAHQNFTGLNVQATKDVELSREIPISNLTRSFQHHHYLLPIPNKDINNNHFVIQNPGY